MLSGALNVHHVMLDGVIWKLRHTRIASILIGGDASPAPAAPATAATATAAPQRAWVRRAVWASGLVGLSLAGLGELEKQLGLLPAIDSGDPARLEASLDRLSWMGRDNASARSRLGLLRHQQGDTEAALRHYERSLALLPRALTWLRIGRLHEQEGRIAEALAAYDRALELSPDDVDTLVAASRASLKSGRADRAQHLLARAAELNPEHDGVRGVLDAIQRRAASAPNL
jgi:tetratricopeptide (TPR) repeat protein